MGRDPGAAPRVREALAPWRREERAARAALKASRPAPRPTASAGKRCAPQQVAAWPFCASEALAAAQRDYLDALDAASPPLAVAHTLAQGFIALLRAREVAALERWLARTEARNVHEFRGFAAALHRDQATIAAALTGPGIPGRWNAR